MAQNIPFALFLIRIFVFVLTIIVSAALYGTFWIKIDPVLRELGNKPKPFLFLNSAFEHLWEYKKVQIAKGEPLSAYRFCMRLLLAQWALIVMWIALMVVHWCVMGDTAQNF